jgi:antitoxin component of MazEF toxin-antitoxin module
MNIMNTAKLRAIGGSVSVTLPRPMLRQMGLDAGHEVEITSDGRSLTLAPKRKRYSLAELVRGMKPGDMPAAPDWEAMPPAGREAW